MKRVILLHENDRIFESDFVARVTRITKVMILVRVEVAAVVTAIIESIILQLLQKTSIRSLHNRISFFVHLSVVIFSLPDYNSNHELRKLYFELAKPLIASRGGPGASA